MASDKKSSFPFSNSEHVNLHTVLNSRSDFFATQVQTPVTLVCQFYPYCDVNLNVSAGVQSGGRRGTGSPFKS